MGLSRAQRERPQDMGTRSPLRAFDSRSTIPTPCVVVVATTIIAGGIASHKWLGFAAACLVLMCFKLPGVLSDWMYRNQQRGRQRREDKRLRLVAAWAKADHPPSTLSAEQAPRFGADDPRLLSFLDENGYAVVKNVASPSEVAAAKQLLWHFLEENASMRRDDPSSWSDNHFRTIGDPTNGIISGNGFGHSEVCWFLRTLKGVRRAFEALWGTDDLIASFDGGNVFRPHHRPGCARHRTNGGWWHVDQGRSKRGRHAVQGLVSLHDATAATGGLCVIPGSHHDHENLLSYTNTSPEGSDFVVVPAPQINPAVRSGVLVTCKAGDMVLWDSRTIHCNAPSLEPPSADAGYAEDELLRAVTYVCMTPRRMATTATLRARRCAAALGVGSTHWPHDLRTLCDASILEQADETEIERALQQMKREQRELVG